MARIGGISLQSKALRLGMAVAVSILVGMDLLFFVIQHATVRGAWQSSHNLIVDDLERMSRRALEHGQPSGLQQEITMMLRGPVELKAVYVENPDGNFLAHSDAQLRGKPAEAWRRSIPRKEVENRRPLRFPDGRVGWAGILYPEPSREKVGRLAHEQSMRALPGMLLADALILLLVGLVSVVVARIIIRPVERLAAAVRRVKDGDFTTTVPVKGGDELAGLQQDFNDMASRLGEVEKLKTDFLAKITHDLRSPIGSIISYAELLDMGGRGAVNAKQKEALAIIVETSKYLAELIGNMLDMAKIEAHRLDFSKQEVDLAAEIESVAAQARGQAERFGVTLSTDVAKGLPPVTADAQALRRVLVNLVSNALKFTPQGGRVTVTARPAHEDRVEVAVSDTGIGIPEEKRSSLFSKFSQVHEANELPRQVVGTGLGLAICKEFVEAQGGRLQVESRSGKGSTFSFSLAALPQRR